MQVKHVCNVLVVFLVSHTTQAVTPYFGIRSQGLNTPRHVSGLVHQLFTNLQPTTQGFLAATLEYERSFHSKDLTNCLFDTTACPSITISGSRVPNRSPHDWLADYFYLPTDFKSKVSFDPVIDNIITDISFYLKLDELRDGLYFTLYAPLVRTRCDLNLCETIDAHGTNTHVPGYFTPATLARNELLNNFAEYANGSTFVGPITQTVGGSDFTITFQPLHAAKISSSRLARTRIADLRMAMGYQFINNDHCQIALEALFSAPTGTRPQGEFLLEPTVGNGHHWEFGASFVGSYTAWKSDNEEKQIIIFGDISLTHLFKSRQKRTFDLINKPFSRYMLIERFGTPITQNLQGGGVAPSAQFKNEFLPVANLTNVHLDSKIALQAEFTACITLACNHLSGDIGYNFWGHTCEQIKLIENPFDNNTTWALKGDSHVFGFDRGAGGAGPLVGAVPLSATQSSATIYGGKNFISATTEAQAVLNPGIDYPQGATGDALAATASNPLSAEPDNTTSTIKTSIDPILLNSFDLHACTQGSYALTSKLFTHLAYTFEEHKRWIPSLGIGGEIEWSHHQRTSFNSCVNACKSCVPCAVSQWGVWLKGSITF